MTAPAKAAVAVSLAAAAGAVALAVATAPAWAPDGPSPLVLVFLAGSLAFLALLAWRRRDHPARSRLLLGAALVVAAGGLGVLAFDYASFRAEPPGEHAPHMHPPIVGLAQWLAVLAVWIVLAIREGRERRAAEAAEKKA